MELKKALAAAAALLCLWAAWYVLVIRPAVRRVGRFGPSWLAWLFTSAAHFVAARVMQIPFQVNLEDAKERGVLEKPCMVAFHPHGAFSGTALMFGGWYWYKLSSVARQYYVCVADLLFRIPFLAEFLVVVNARAANKTTMSKLLKNGHSVAVQPGGIYEQVRWDPELERIYFPPNLGFIRIALEHGVPILPVYVFGENQLYSQTKLTRSLNGFLYKKFGAGVVFVCGRYGLPWIWPRRVPVLWAFGELLEVGEPVADPSDEKVKEVFVEYVKKLRNVWNEHADAMLPKDIAARGLQIVWRGHEDEVL